MKVLLYPSGEALCLETKVECALDVNVTEKASHIRMAWYPIYQNSLTAEGSWLGISVVPECQQ